MAGPSTQITDSQTDTAFTHLFDGEEIHHISLWMPNWIGDVVFVMPVLEVLRRRFPDSRITAIVRSSADELLSCHHVVDSVIRIPWGPDDSVVGHVEFALGLRKYQFDLGVVFPNSMRSALMMFLSGAKRRLGYNTEGRGMFLTHPVPVTRHLKKNEYRVDYFYKALAGLDLEAPKMEFSSLEKNNGDRSVAEILSRTGSEESDFIIAVHPGTSKPERSWHPDRFGILCQKLIKEYRVKIILLGNEKEAELLEHVRRYCPAGSVHILPAMNLREIAAILKVSRLFIGNDSGMMHLAAMVGTPLVGIFGPGSPATTGPYIESEKQEIVTRAFSCSPCRQKFFKECKPSMHNRPYCLEDITIKDVSEAVARLIRRMKPTGF